MSHALHAPTRARRPVPSGRAQLAAALLALLTAEAAVRLLIPADTNLLGQRLSEVHGFASLGALLLVLVARPLRLARYRRALGLSAFVFALLHTWYAFEHVLGGSLDAVAFLSPADQAAVWLGLIALLGLLPLALTSTNGAMRTLGRRWKTLHKLGPVMTVLAAAHTAWIGVHFGLQPLAWTTVALVALTLAAFWFRKAKR